MGELEKVAKLSQRANVSEEEARVALETCGWDLLDAMVYLEKQGKTSEPGQTSYSTSYEEQQQFTSVEETVKSQTSPEGIFKALGHALRAFIIKCRGNNIYMVRHKEVKFRMPLLLFIILGIAFWRVVLPLMIISVFFGCRYTFGGKDDMKQANEAMDKVSELAEQVRDKIKEKL